MTPLRLPVLFAVGAMLAAGCDSSTTSALSASASAKVSASAAATTAKPSAMAAASAPSAAATASGEADSIGVPVPAAPALGKPGEGFASAEEGAAAVAHAIASEDLAAFEVGRPSKEQLDALFLECEKPVAAAIDMKPAVDAGLKTAKGKRPLKAARMAEGDPAKLEAGEGYADCKKVAKDVEIRVFGFLIHDADGKDAFADGGMGIGFFALGEPARWYITTPK